MNGLYDWIYLKSISGGLNKAEYVQIVFTYFYFCCDAVVAVPVQTNIYVVWTDLGNINRITFGPCRMDASGLHRPDHIWATYCRPITPGSPVCNTHSLCIHMKRMNWKKHIFWKNMNKINGSQCLKSGTFWYLNGFYSWNYNALIKIQITEYCEWWRITICVFIYLEYLTDCGRCRTWI